MVTLVIYIKDCDYAIYIPFNWMAVMLFVLGTSSIVQFFVSKFLFTHITDHIGSLFCSLLIGNTGLKFAGVQIALKVMVYGS